MGCWYTNDLKIAASDWHISQLTFTRFASGPMASLRKLLRNAVVEALAFLPFTARLLKIPLLNRCILWILFRLERDDLTVAAAGPRFCRYRMWLNWQDG